MKSNLNKIVALLHIFLLIFSPFAAALDPSTADGTASPTSSDQFYDQFSKDPALWTANNFDKLSPADQAEFLSNNYQPALALEFYKNQNNVGLNSQVDFKYFADKNNFGKNPLADEKFYSSNYAGATLTTLRDFLQLGSGQKDAAAQYFTQKFAAAYTFTEVDNDFQYNAQEGTLTNGKKTISLNEFKGDASIQGIVSIADGFKIIRKQEQGVQEVSVQGDAQRKIQYDQKNGNLLFKDAQGKEQSFDLAAGHAVNFKFETDGTLEITGPVSGIVNLNNEHKFAEFRNREGKLIFHANGDIEARDALVETAKLYLDGRFESHKESNLVDAYDVMGDDRKTIIVDKDSRVGAKTQGQIKGESTLKVYLSKISAQSDYAVKPAAANAQQPTVKDVIDNLQKVHPPQGNLGDNAEVYIKKSEDTGKTIVTAKGKVDLGFYDFVTGSVSLSEKEPHFIGINGISEFDYLGAPQKQINVRGQAVYSDDQYSRIDTKQNGASLKIIRNELDDVIHSGCFNCQVGSTAMSIGKLVATATPAGDTFSQPHFKTLSISATVTKDGLEYNWNSFLSDLGDLARSKTEGEEIILGKNLLMKNVACEGSKQCNLMLARDQQSGVTSAFYEVYDPATNQVSKRVAIPTDIGTTLGKATILTSSDNADKLQKIQILIQQNRFSEVSSLLKDQPFDQDPALREHLLKTIGIDINQLDQPEYAQKLNGILKSYSDAQDKIQSLRQNYDINLDEHGLAASAEDQQKLNEILTKKRAGNERAIFDLYTGARVDLARSEQQQLEAMHQSCAGTSSCSVSDEEVKEANKKVITEVLRRENSPEGVEWKQNVILEQEREKQAKEQQQEAELLKDKLADAQKLGKKRDDAESDLTRNQAVLAKTVRDIKDQEAKVAQLEADRKEKQKSISGRDVLNVVFTFGKGIEDDLALQRQIEEFAQKELSGLQQQKFSLEKRIEKNQEALKNINNDLSGLTQDFKQPTSKLALLSAYGDDETVGKMIKNSDLPQEKKLELLQKYLGPEVGNKIKELYANRYSSEAAFSQSEKQIDDLLGNGKNALRQAQNYAQYYGDIAGASVILDHIGATRLDLVDSPEWRAAKAAYDQAVDNRVTELKEIAQQNLQDKINQRDGKESSIFSGDSIADRTISALGTGAEKLGSGLRFASMKAVAGTLYATGGISQVVTGGQAGGSLSNAAEALYYYDDAKHAQADAEIKALNQEIKSYDKLRGLIATARQSGTETDTSAKIQDAFKLQASIVNLGKQMQGKELTIDDHAKEALYNTEQHALVAGGDELVKNEYKAILAEYGDKSEEVAVAAYTKVREAETVTGPLAEYGIGFTKEQAALYGDPIIDVTVDVTNLIPGVLFFKAGEVAAKVAKVAKVTEAFAEVGKAVEAVKDAGKLLTVSNEARVTLQAAKAELGAAQITKGLTVAERTAEIARAEQKVTLAAQTAEAEYRASKVGKASAFLSTPVSSDLRAIEKLRLAAQDDQFKAAQNLQQAVSVEEAHAAQQAYQAAAQKVNDFDKAKQAYSKAGSTTLESTALGKQYAVGPGAEKAQQALDDFQKAREAYHTEKIAFGADKVSQATIDNVVTTAKAAEKASFENRVSDAIRGAIGAQRAERNIEQLKAAEIVISFTKEGKLVAEGVQEGSEEAKLVENTNKLLEDQRVVQRIVGDDASRLAKPENVPAPPRKLSAQEFTELETLDKELEARGARYKLNDQGIAEINIDDVVTKDAKDLDQLKQKAQRVEQLSDQADKDALAKQLQVRRNAEAVLADNDLQQVAKDVKNDLAAKASGKRDAGIIPEVAGEKAAELPKPIAKSEARIAAADDLPRPGAIEEAIDSRSAGTASILRPVQQEGKEARGLAKISDSTTVDENAQRVLGAIPEAGGEVKVKTLNGNVYEGKVLAKDDNVLVLEQAGRRQRITTGKVAEVEVIEAPKVRGASENLNPCNLVPAAIYGLAPCELRTAAQTPVAKQLPGAEAKPVIEIPPRIPGQDDWNDIVHVLETNLNGKLDESSLETLVNKKDLLLGKGGEGVVLEIPEAARVQLPGVDRPAIIKIRNINPSLEDVANSFPEQADVLNRLADYGAAPHVYKAEDTYYIAEKIDGKSLKDTIFERLSPQTRAEYEYHVSQYKNIKREMFQNIQEFQRAQNAEFQQARAVLAKALLDEPQIDEVKNAVEGLTTILKTENVEIADFHWNNVIVVTTPEGKLEAKLLDAGFALPGDPDTIGKVYDNKLFDAMTQGGFEVDTVKFGQTKIERAVTGVSDEVVLADEVTIVPPSLEKRVSTVPSEKGNIQLPESLEARVNSVRSPQDLPALKQEIDLQLFPGKKVPAGISDEDVVKLYENCPECFEKKSTNKGIDKYVLKGDEIYVNVEEGKAVQGIGRGYRHALKHDPEFSGGLDAVLDNLGKKPSFTISSQKNTLTVSRDEGKTLEVIIRDSDGNFVSAYTAKESAKAPVIQAGEVKDKAVLKLLEGPATQGQAKVFASKDGTKLLTHYEGTDAGLLYTKTEGKITVEGVSGLEKKGIDTTVFGDPLSKSKSRKVFDEFKTGYAEEKIEVDLSGLIGSERNVVSTVVEPCAVAGGAIVGLAPCVSGLEIKLAEIPYERDWNQVVQSIEQNKNAKKLPNEIKSQLFTNRLFVGRGSEGTVLDVPPSVRAYYGLTEEAVIKVRTDEIPQYNSFREQARILEDLSQEGVAPKIFNSGDNYYIAEKVSGQRLDEIMPTLDLTGRNELRLKLEKLVDALAKKDYNVLDFNTRNVLLTPNGELKIVDAGLAFKWEGSPEVLQRAYKDRIDKLLDQIWDGLEFNEIDDLKMLKKYQPCAVAGGAIVGQAPCQAGVATVPAFIPESPQAIEQHVRDLQKQDVVLGNNPEATVRSMVVLEQPLTAKPGDVFVYHKTPAQNLEGIVQSGGLEGGRNTQRLEKDLQIDSFAEANLPEHLRGQDYARSKAVFATPLEKGLAVGLVKDEETTIKVAVNSKDTIVVSSDQATNALTAARNGDAAALQQASKSYWKDAVSLEDFNRYYTLEYQGATEIHALDVQKYLKAKLPYKLPTTIINPEVLIPQKVSVDALEIVDYGKDIKRALPEGKSLIGKLLPAIDDGKGVFEVGGQKYVYSTERGWTTKGFLGFGKKSVTDADQLTSLEAARLNVPVEQVQLNQKVEKISTTAPSLIKITSPQPEKLIFNPELSKLFSAYPGTTPKKGVYIDQSTGLKYLIKQPRDWDEFVAEETLSQMNEKLKLPTQDAHVITLPIPDAEGNLIPEKVVASRLLTEEPLDINQVPLQEIRNKDQIYEQSVVQVLLGNQDIGGNVIAVRTCSTCTEFDAVYIDAGAAGLTKNSQGRSFSALIADSLPEQFKGTGTFDNFEPTITKIETTFTDDYVSRLAENYQKRKLITSAQKNEFVETLQFRRDNLRRSYCVDLAACGDPRCAAVC